VNPKTDSAIIENALDLADWRAPAKPRTDEHPGAKTATGQGSLDAGGAAGSRNKSLLLQP